MKNKKILIIVIILLIIGIIGGIIGIIYFNNQKPDNTQTNITAAETDISAPTLNLTAESNENGDYFITLMRGDETNNFDPYTLVESVSDDVSSPENINVECNAILDTAKSTQYISYIVTDEAGNSSTVKLLIIYSDDDDKIKEDQQEQIAQMEEEIAKLEEEQARLAEEERLRKEAEEKAKAEAEAAEAAKKQEEQQKPSTEPKQPTNPEPKPPANVYHTVNNFTISSSDNLQAALQAGAMANCSYGGCNGVLGAYSFDMNGNTIVIHWTCTCGWTGTSTATIQ